MKILIVCATDLEIRSIKRKLLGKQTLTNAESCRYKDIQISFLVTGVGMVCTTYFLLKKLTEVKFNLVINAGLAGSFNRKTEIGTVFHVVSDCFSETGAEDGKNFLSLFQMGLAGMNDFPFSNGKLVNKLVMNYQVLKNLPEAHAITVNTVHGNRNSIRKVINAFHPDLESMEGAAFFYVCLMKKVRFIQIRAISNLVERRNTKAWDIPLALKNMNRTLITLLEEISVKRT